MEARSLISALLAASILAALSTPPSRGQGPADPFADCETRLQTDPEDPRAAQCFFDTARAEALWEKAAQKLATYRALHPDNPWLYINSGHVQLFSRHRRQRSEAYYRDALRIAQRLGDGAAEVEARLALARYYAKNSDLDRADEVLAPAVGIAEQEMEPGLLAKVRIRQTWQHYYRGEDLDYAYHLLQGVEQDVLQAGSKDLRRQWLDAMAIVSYNLGRNEDYLKYKKRLLAMARETGDRALEAAARFDIAIQYLAAELPTMEARREARLLFEAALKAAEAARHPSIEGQARRVLGKMLAGEEGREHLAICIDIAEDLADSRLLNLCRGALAAAWLERDRDQAQELIEQTLAALSNSSDPWSMPLGWEERLPVQWAVLPHQEAVRRSLEVLDSIESLRELQGSGSGRARLTSVWSGIYYWLSGRLLDDREHATDLRRRSDLELAFNVAERMRARVLLESLEAAGAVVVEPELEPLLQELDKILESKVKIHLRLLDPGLKAAARESRIAELDAIESEEAKLRHLIAQASRSFAEFRNPEIADLDRVEKNLKETEAILSYQLGLDNDVYGRFAGGSWLLVSTRQGTRSYRLPDRVALDPRLDLIAGLTDLDAAKKALASLYDVLLQAALDDLPDAVEKLIIVPDGQLYRLPFTLLRSDVDADPLIARYQLSLAPSATLWLRWRQQAPPTSTAPVLAFADPLVAGQESTDPASTRAWALARGARLSPLPYARREGRAVVRILGGESRLLEREAATETFVKTHDLRKFGILHFAAHAMIDEQVPERSAVFLARGSEEEDGWLLPQEIVQLDLRGRVVVLASCDTAAGQILRGEGPMSLARSFFQAGAPVVVASLWQLPDDRTSTLIKKFYRRLARGASVAEAMAGAQREMIRGGASAREWAGLVVLGDGAMIPFPGGLPRPIRWRLVAVIAAATAILAVIVLRRRSLQRRSLQK